MLRCCNLYFAMADTHMLCFACGQASSTGAASQYDFALDSDGQGVALTDRQQQQARIAQNRSCSSLILANASITGNTAEGAGGALYLTSPEGFFLLNGEPLMTMPTAAHHALHAELQPGTCFLAVDLLLTC